MGRVGEAGVSGEEGRVECIRSTKQLTKSVGSHVGSVNQKGGLHHFSPKLSVFFL